MLNGLVWIRPYLSYYDVKALGRRPFNHPRPLSLIKMSMIPVMEYTPKHYIID